MARGGQLFAPAPQPMNWMGILLKVLIGLVAVYVIYRAFFRNCTGLLKKEKFGGDCPCNKKRSNGFFLL
jgi:hypothetical protein